MLNHIISYYNNYYQHILPVITIPVYPHIHYYKVIIINNISII